MSLPPLKTIVSLNFDVTTLQQNVSASINPLLGAPDSDKVALLNIALSNVGYRDVPHKLGRVITGWVVTRINAGAMVWDGQSANPTPDKFLRLYCSAPCTINLMVW